MSEKRCYGPVDLFVLVFGEETDKRHYYLTALKAILTTVWEQLVKKHNHRFTKYGFLDIVNDGRTLTVTKPKFGRPLPEDAPWKGGGDMLSDEALLESVSILLSGWSSDSEIKLS